jgi:hypothetical protein
MVVMFKSLQAMEAMFWAADKPFQPTPQMHVALLEQFL